MTLSEQLETAKKRAEIETLNIGDEKAAGEFAKRISLPPLDLSADIRTLLDPFNKWASQRHARRCPAKPATVALFALEQADMGVAVDVILAQLNAIEAMHDKFSLPNPVRTLAVEYAMATLLKADPPRSWSKSEKGQWALLPASIRSAITRRENDRDHETRRLQSKVARELLELRQTSSADTKIAHSNEKDQTMSRIMRRDDSVKPGCGIDGGMDEGFQTKNIDKGAEKAMYGDGKDITSRHNSKDING